jgi:hypothetical protein
MSTEIPRGVRPVTPRPAGRFRRNTPRKVSLFLGLAAVLTIMVGAGFASMSASGAATSAETFAVRWIAIGFLAVGAVFYVIGGRAESPGQN